MSTVARSAHVRPDVPNIEAISLSGNGSPGGGKREATRHHSFLRALPAGANLEQFEFSFPASQ
jgi:hypothetical protein